MAGSEEQQFDFGAEVATVLEGRATRAARGRRASSAVASTDPGADMAQVLRERIERLKDRASRAVDAEAADGPHDPHADERDSGADRSAGVAEEPSDDQALTIAQFYAQLKQAITGRFPDEIWVTGEIRSLRASNGHRFIELADQGADQRPAQQLEVCCWAQTWRSVDASLSAAGLELEVGRVVRVLGKVSVWEAAGRVRFTLSRIDVEAMLGGIAAARQRLLRQLSAEGLLEANRSLRLPPVPLRVGLVTSQGSEAHKDFLGRLTRSGFAFSVELAHSLVQGADAPGQIAQAISRLAGRELDLIVLARGGGSRNDLAAFDAEVVARAIASSPLPVWVGVGHTGDHSVADEVAHRSFITPTACGEAVVEEVARYWDEVCWRADHLAGLVRNRLVGADRELAHAHRQLARAVVACMAREEHNGHAGRARVASAAMHLVRAQRADLQRRRQHLANSVRHCGERYEQIISQRADLLRAFDPRRQLARGWAIVCDRDGQLVRSVAQVLPGDEIRARLVDGGVRTVVQSVDTETGPARTNPGASGSGHEE